MTQGETLKIMAVLQAAYPNFYRGMTRQDAEGVVVRTREKEAISRHAIAGAYMFARGADFVRAAINMMIYGDKAKNEYYMSNVYNHAVRLGLKTGVYDIAADAFACVGTPRQLREYLER